MAPVQRFIGLARQHFWRSFAFLSNFGLSKGIAFLGPLALATYLPQAIYGQIEFSLAWALLGALGLSLGVSASVPQIALLGKKESIGDVLATVVVVSGGLCLLVALAAHIIAGKSVWGIMAVTIALAMAQYTSSTFARTRSLRNLATWTDNSTLIWISLAGLGLAACLRLGLVPIDDAATGLFWALFIIAASQWSLALFVLLFRRAPELSKRMRQAIKLGIPLGLASAVSVWFAVSGRALLGKTLGLEAVSIYGFLARAAALVLIVHYLAVTAFFSKLYTLHSRKFDQLCAAYLAFIGVVCWVIGILGTIFLPSFHLEALSGLADKDLGPLLMMVLASSFGWLVAGSLEMRLNRSRRAKPAMIMGIGTAIICATALLGLHLFGHLNLYGAATIITVQWIGLSCGYLYVLWRRGMKLRLVTLTTFVAYGVICASSILLDILG